MATTKKFDRMSTKKLTALLATASDEDQAAIQEVLNAREAAKAQAAEEGEEGEDGEDGLTEEERKAIAYAEEHDGANPLYNGSKATAEKKPKATEEERHALAEELRANIGRKCKVVPFNTVDWIDGYIAGVMEEKRTNKVLYIIKSFDGRRIVKMHDSNLLQLLDETVEITRAPRAPRAKRSQADMPEWTPEMIAEKVNEVIGNVGKAVKIEKFRSVGEDGVEHVEYDEGRITAIIPDKRAQRVLYRISIPAPVEGNPLAVKTVHKVTTAEMDIAEELDAEGLEFNNKYRARRDAAGTRSPRTPQDKIALAEEQLKKTEAKLAKLNEELENRKKALATAQAELEAYNANAAVGGGNAEENEDLA